MLRTNRVSTTKPLVKREAPRWLLMVVAIVGVTVLAYWGRQALVGREGEPGPRMKVYPGMYDLRAEAAKARAAREGSSALHGSGQ